MRLGAVTDPASGPGRLAEQILALADTLAQVLDRAATQRLPVPSPVSNAVHDLRGWAARLHHPGSARPTGANAARMIAYIRGLPDHQLLALLADLPWARLDALLDTTAQPTPEPLDASATSNRKPDPTGWPSSPRRR